MHTPAITPDNLETFFLDFLTLEDGINKLSQHVGTELLLYAA
jgi:hypothetical protein